MWLSVGRENVKSADESIYVKKRKLSSNFVWQSDKSRMKMIVAIFYDADFNEPWGWRILRKLVKIRQDNMKSADVSIHVKKWKLSINFV